MVERKDLSKEIPLRWRFCNDISHSCGRPTVQILPLSKTSLLSPNVTNSIYIECMVISAYVSMSTNVAAGNETAIQFWYLSNCQAGLNVNDYLFSSKLLDGYKERAGL